MLKLLYWLSATTSPEGPSHRMVTSIGLVFTSRVCNVALLPNMACTGVEVGYGLRFGLTKNVKERGKLPKWHVENINLTVYINIDSLRRVTSIIEGCASVPATIAGKHRIDNQHWWGQLSISIIENHDTIICVHTSIDMQSLNICHMYSSSISNLLPSHLGMRIKDYVYIPAVIRIVGISA